MSPTKIEANSPDMHQHVGNEPPCLLPFVRIVDEKFRNRPGGVSFPVSGVVTKQYNLNHRYQYHADGGRPARVLFLVSAVCVCEDCLATTGVGF